MIRIKNWEKFQHYKHRDPPWIRVYKGLLNDREWFALDDGAARKLVEFWLIASESDGALPNPKDLAFRLRITEKQVASVLSKLSHWLEHDASTTLAECERHALPETETETETETDNTETDIRAVANATRPDRDEAFEQFWKAYPKREGANPKAPARKSFDAAVRSGADPPAIVAGAVAYAADPSTKIGTSYVAQAVTWLNQKRWQDHVATSGKVDVDALERHRRECLKRPEAEIRRDTGVGSSWPNIPQEFRS